MAKPEQIKDTKLKAMMTEAHELMRANRPTESVKALAAAFECLLELQPEIIGSSHARDGKRHFFRDGRSSVRTSKRAH